MVPDFTFKNYYRAITETTYQILLVRSLIIGLLASVATIALAYPISYMMVFQAKKYRDLILFLVIITLFTNYLVRIYAWRSILSTNGLVDYVFTWLGLVDEHRSYLLFTSAGTFVALVNAWLPIAVLPIYAALLNISDTVIEASRDLGATPFRSFVKVIVPLSSPGIYAGFTLVFLLSVGDFVTPILVGGTNGAMIGGAIQRQFGENFNWPLGSALAFTTTIAMAVVLIALTIAARRLGLIRRVDV